MPSERKPAEGGIELTERRELKKRSKPGGKSRDLSTVLFVLAALFAAAALFVPFRFGAWTEVENGWPSSPETPASPSVRGVPDVYEAECPRPGTVVPLSYVSCRFDDPSVEAVRTAYVYLPYGYGEEETYEVLYLLHGTGSNPASWLLEHPANKNAVDNLIDRGDVRPLLIVTPPLFPPEEFGLPEEDVGRQFSFELREKLIPAAESRFSCRTSADPEQARSNRAIAGVSRGARAVFESGLGDGLDLFSRFGAFSGMLTDPEDLAEKIGRGEARPENRIDLLFQVNGFYDYTFYEHGFRAILLDALSDRLQPGENDVFLLIRNGEHTWPSWEAALYNFLLSAFPSGGGVRLPEEIISSSNFSGFLR
ncbi:MAG: hypothetical protein ILO68_00435 [Clostridia bacterium]|nr:hypothetical protein [Clostridia bacterium]